MYEGIGIIRFLGQPFSIDRATCARCKQPVYLVAAPGHKTGLYDRILLVAATDGGNPRGTRHHCPASPGTDPASRQCDLPGLSPDPSAGNGPYGQKRRYKIDG